jgi:putative transposase
VFVQPFLLDELRFAYCYRVFLRWRTHRAKPNPALPGLDRSALATLANEFGIHLLESAANETDLLALVSLKPEETISACTGKLKGRVSKWLREAMQLTAPTDLLSRGYFGCTTGKSARAAVEEYLSTQAEHHGYKNRVVSPTHVESFALEAAEEARLTPAHAAVVAQYHIVLATRGRRGVFGSTESRAVIEAWRQKQANWQLALRKVSFLPDHVHIALRAHPAVSPAALTLELMNAAQRVVFEQFPEVVLQARVERLWQPSAYVGSYGEVTSPEMRKYIENWVGKHATAPALPEAPPEELQFSDE